MRVLYIAGTGRSGSTVFELALGQRLSVPSTGELVTAFRRGVLEDRTCSCGAPFSGCPFWQSVVDTDPAAFTRANAEHVASGLLRVLHALGPLRCFTGAQRDRLARLVDDAWYRSMGALYRGVAEVSGSAMFTDSSKAPALAVLLARIDGLELDLVHLVRDPRLVGRSWQRPHDVPAGTAPMPRLAPWRSALVWSMVNEASARVGRALPGRSATVRFDDFVRAPAVVLSQTVQALGVADASGTGTAEPLLIAPAAHTMSGNPPVRLRRDAFAVDATTAASRSRSPAVLADAVTASLTLPLLGRYGYPLRVGRLP